MTLLDESGDGSDYQIPGEAFADLFAYKELGSKFGARTFLQVQPSLLRHEGTNGPLGSLTLHDGKSR